MTSPRKIQAISPEGINSVSTGLSTEDLQMKFGLYSLSMSLYALKVDVVSSLKVDLCKFKLYNDGAKISLEDLALTNTKTAWIAKAAVTLLG